MLVWDKRYNEESVIKSIGVLFNENDGKYGQKKAIEQAEIEINILKRLEHPGIIKYRGCRHQITNRPDWWKNQSFIYIHMDYVPGGTLTKFLQQRKQTKQRFTEAEVLDFLKQIIAALRHAHSHNVWHRDIKPENILVDNDSGSKPKYILADFGGARFIDDKSAQSLTVQIGTKGY